MRIGDLVRLSRQSAFMIESRCSINEAIEKILRTNGGALVVLEQDTPLGIITANDLLRTTLQDGTAGFETVNLKDLMTPNLITAGPEDDLSTTMNMMLNAGIDHLPVANESGVIGILRLRDLLKQQVAELEREVNDLKEYIADLHEASLD